MLDLLDLALDCGRGRSKDRQNPTREERFNIILAKLKERNTANDGFIKRFRQKAARKKLKFPQIANRINDPHLESQSEQRERDEAGDDVESSKHSIHQNQKENPFSRKEITKENILKQTNHTLTQDASDDEEKTLSFPNLDFCSQEIDPSPSKRPKQPFQNMKQDKQFNKYLRNVFFKEMASKIESKKVLADRQESEARRSMGRMKTQMSSKFQLSIKSLIFGNLDGSSQGKFKNQCSGKYPRVQAAIDRIKNMQRYDKDYQFEDTKMSSKGMLPIIHNHQVTKNKRFLENYIKYNNHERHNQIHAAQTRTISLGNEPQIISKKQMPSRIGLSLRIQTINIQKSP